MKRKNGSMRDRTGKNPAAESLFAQSQALFRNGDIDGAQRLYERLLATEPNHAAALHNLALIAQQRGQHELADKLFTRAIRLNPDEPSYHLNFAKSLAFLGKPDAAVTQYETALQLKPDYPLAHNNLATILLSLNRLEGAVEHFRLALRQKPGYEPALLGLGNALAQADKANDAVTLFRHALRLNPGNGAAYKGLAEALKDMGRMDEAIAYLSQALRLNPRNLEARNLQGAMYYHVGRFQEALELYDESLRLSPDAPATHINQALVLLATGEIDRGWVEYEWRLKMDKWRRGFPQPFWNGENLAGKTLFIWEEQGVGDELLFANMFPDAIAAAGHCVIECDPRLASLFARSFPAAEVIPRTVPPHPRTSASDVQLQSAASSLARWLRASLDQFPRDGYLVASPERVAFWKKRLAELGGGPKVGISWRSMNMARERIQYYSRLSDWQHILSVPTVTFVNLQYDDCTAELADVAARFGVKVHTWDDVDLMNDLDEVAALITALDLVVSAQNAVACMAGGLGIRVWSILPLKAAWPMLGTSHMPWFPSMRLFSRDWRDPWDVVIEEIGQELRAFTAAKSSFEKPSCASEPNSSIDGLMARANACHHAGELRQAETLYLQVLELAPHNVDALHLLGVIAHQEGQVDHAVDLISKAIAIDNTHPGFYLNHGNALRDQGKLDEAARSFRDAIRLDPHYHKAYNNLGVVLTDQGKLEAAIDCLTNALRLNVSYPEGHLNLGKALQQLGKLDQAVEHYQEALRSKANYLEAYVNLGTAFKEQGRHAEAFACFDKALRLQPDHVDAHWNLSLTLLLSGHLAEGWKEYDWRLGRDIATGRHKTSPPWWEGGSLAGKTVLLRAEQGVGDEMMFANIFHDVIAAAQHCVIECDPRLLPLFSRSFPAAEIIPRSIHPHPGTTQADVTAQIPAGSLARFFRCGITKFPEHSGYLIPDPARVAFWKQRLAELGPQPKIGICWRSKLQSRDRTLAYTKLTQWGPIFAVPGLAFVNLQYDDCQAELEEAENLFGTHIHTWNDIDLMNDLDEVAALIKALDLVISAGTAVAQMAGALGIPVWEFSPDANWTALGTGKSPWYPSMRLFNRRWNEPWDGIITNVARELVQTVPRDE